MKERPILFSAPMVRAILDGTKTQTRRVIKPQPITLNNLWYWFLYIKCVGFKNMDELAKIMKPHCKYGQVGDQLWVRETYYPIYPQDPTYNNGNPIEYDYAATYKHGDRLGDLMGVKKKWKPSIHMPRKASRIQLEITNIRVERLNEISAKDIINEGAVLRAHDDEFGHNPVSAFDQKVYMDLRSLWAKGWESINGTGSWDKNPWVWVIEFRRVKP